MTTVNVGNGIADPTHDMSLSDGTTTLGLIFAGGPRVLQEIPLSPPAQQFQNEQRNWIGGRGRLRYDDDPTGYFDDNFLWSTTEGKLMPSLQWRFGAGLRSCDSNMPADNATLSWWSLYGNTPASDIARYLSGSFAASATYSADQAYLIIRRVGTPGTLTVELCAASSGNPGTVLQTVTLTAASVGVYSVFKAFDWTSTESLTSGTNYHIKIYGASTDNASNHWKVLTNASGSNSKYSTDNSAWTAAGVTMYYRVTDADTSRQWRFFFHEGVLYAVSQADAGGTPVLMRNGECGTATAATSTTLSCSALSMTTDEYAAATGRQAALIRIFDGTGDGQVRTITANTGTQFTVSPAWSVTPDVTSRFIVYGTDRWTVLTGHGLTLTTGKPVSTGPVCYFPQGSTAVRRMRLNGNTYEYAADGTNTAHLLGLHMEGATLKVVAGYRATATIKVADATAWGVNLTLGAAKTIGTTDYRISNIYSHNKTLYIFKEDGVYTYTNGIVERIGSNFSDVPDTYTGFGVGAQNQYLWFGWAHSIERMLGSSVDDMMNYKRGFDGMPEDRVGSCTSIVSAVGWLFFIVDGGSLNYSSIIIWNGFGWHEIYRAWAPGVRIRNAIWQPCLEGRGRLWFDVDGDIAYMEFPQYAANPLQDTNNSPKGYGVNYHWEGAVVTATYDNHDQNLYKVLQTIRIFLDEGSVEVSYQINGDVGSSTWTVLGTASTTPVTDIDLNLGEVFQIRFLFRMYPSDTRVGCVLSGWQLSGRMMDLAKYQYLATFKTDSDQTTFTDEPDINPDTLYSTLLSWATTQKKLTMRTQSSSSDSKIVTVSLPSKSVDWIDSQENKWGGRVSAAILEV